MKKQLISIALILFLALMNSSSFAAAEEKNRAPETEDTCLNESVIKLKYGMQKLWIEHAWWTRSIIVSKLADLEDQKDVLDRLLQNQVELGNIIKPYYGDEAGNKLTELLKEHIVIAGQMVDAAKKGDQGNFNELNKKLRQNADEIVTFLSGANPNLQQAELSEMFNTHLQLTIDEVNHRLNKNWPADIRTADLNETHLIKMGDMLTDAIVKQFPEKFK